MPITNETMRSYAFLKDMYDDSYFPKVCVDAVKAVFVGLCEEIERTKPSELADLYKLTHAATERINDLEDMFGEHDSEIETGAREAIAENFAFVADAYGFASAEIEELIAPREW